MEAENEVLMVLANYNFNDDEHDYTQKALEDSGIKIRIAAAEHGECTSVTGKTIDTDISLQNIVPDNFRAIIFIGGPGVDTYFNDDSALNLAREFFKSNKIVAAICWAPVILAKAGILTQRRATCWDGAKNDLVSSGAIYTGEKVTVDGTIVTADGPESALDFGKKIVEMLGSIKN